MYPLREPNLKSLQILVALNVDHISVRLDLRSIGMAIKYKLNKNEYQELVKKLIKMDLTNVNYLKFSKGKKG
jgi:hypothetical protein